MPSATHPGLATIVAVFRAPSSVRAGEATAESAPLPHRGEALVFVVGIDQRGRTGAADRVDNSLRSIGFFSTGIAK